jgi:site-specific recombinase XerD
MQRSDSSAMTASGRRIGWILVPHPQPHATAQLRLQAFTRAIQHYLGHRSIASTVRYTALAPDRFKHFWKD